MIEPGPESAKCALPDTLATDQAFRHLFTLAAGSLCDSPTQITILEALCALAFAHGELYGTRDCIARLRANEAITKASSGESPT